MKKEIWSKVILILGMVISFPSMYAYDFEVDSVYYNIISMDDMTCEIDGGHPDMTILNLSGVVSFKGREFKVNGMKPEAFKDSKIVSLSVEGLEEIPEKAFF